MRRGNRALQTTRFADVCDENPLASLFGAQDKRKCFCCLAEAVKSARFGSAATTAPRIAAGYADSPCATRFGGAHSCENSASRCLKAVISPQFGNDLLGWFRKYQRDLPWRSNKDPYRIWLSEIMLQQTRVAAVIPYYERFLERFPKIRALADAPEEEVLRIVVGPRLLQPRAKFAAGSAADRRETWRRVSANRRRSAVAAGHRKLHRGCDSEHRVRGEARCARRKRGARARAVRCYSRRFARERTLASRCRNPRTSCSIRNHRAIGTRP